MAVFMCKNCGADLNVTEGVSVVQCESCGSHQTVPTANSEKKMNLFLRANRQRRHCEFDKAAGIYESIVAEFPQEAEAYWGLILCKYGIEYVEDPGTGKKIPTCHRSSYDSVLDDSDLVKTLENADVLSRPVYLAEAQVIENLRKGIVEVSSKEQPYDIFICYKESDEYGDRTNDSVLAQDIYDMLTEKGYRVFFSRISLEDKLGQAYEPYIFGALRSAKVMLAVSADPEYYNAVWVKNEWSRYLSLMAAGEKKYLIPCYKNMTIDEMPREFARLQAQDIGKVGALQDLLRGIEKLIGKKRPDPAPESQIPQRPAAGTKRTSGQSHWDAENYDRAMILMDDGEWNKARNEFDSMNHRDLTNPVPYLGFAMVNYQASTMDLLHQKYVADYKLENKNMQRAMKYAKGDLLQQLKGWEKERHTAFAKEKYELGMSYMTGKAQNAQVLREAAMCFQSAGDYRDAKELTEKCAQKSHEYQTAAEQQKVEEKYNAAVKSAGNAKTKKDFDNAIQQLSALDGYKDSAEQLKRCIERRGKVVNIKEKSFPLWIPLVGLIVTFYPIILVIAKAGSVDQFFTDYNTRVTYWSVCGWAATLIAVIEGWRKYSIFAGIGCGLTAQVAHLICNLIVRMTVGKRFGDMAGFFFSVIVFIFLLIWISVINGKRKKKRAAAYGAACAEMEKDPMEALKKFQTIAGYKDANKRAEECAQAVVAASTAASAPQIKEKVDTQTILAEDPREKIYQEAVSLYKSHTREGVERAMRLYESIADYKDSGFNIELCKHWINGFDGMITYAVKK